MHIPHQSYSDFTSNSAGQWIVYEACIKIADSWLELGRTSPQSGGFMQSPLYEV